MFIFLRNEGLLKVVLISNLQGRLRFSPPPILLLILNHDESVDDDWGFAFYESVLLTLSFQ